MNKRSLLLLFSVVFMDMVGFGFIIPLLPDYVAGFGGTSTLVGLLSSVYALGQFIAAPVAGRLSDRFGRKPLLLIGFLSTGLMYIVYGHTRTIASLVGLESLIAVLILLGVISFLFAFLLLFTWPQIITLSADYSLPKSRGRIMAIQGMMMGISQIIMFGVLGQLPKRIGIMPMFYIGAFCSSIQNLNLMFPTSEQALEVKIVGKVNNVYSSILACTVEKKILVSI